MLRPVFVDARSGYRFYDPSQAETASLVRLLRACGVPLRAVAEIVGLVAGGHSAEARRRVAEHWALIQRRHEQARAVVASIHEFIDKEVSMVRSTLPSAEFAGALEQVIAAAGDDGERPVLMSVLFGP